MGRGTRWGYSPPGHKKSDTTEWLSLSLFWLNIYYIKYSTKKKGICNKTEFIAFAIFSVNSFYWGFIQLSSVAQLCLTLCDAVNCSMPGLPVHHQLPESTQTHVHWVSDAIQPSQPLSSPSPPALNLSQHQGLFKWVSSSHQIAKVLEFQLQHQFYQWTPRTHLL